MGLGAAPPWRTWGASAKEQTRAVNNTILPADLIIFITVPWNLDREYIHV